MVPFFGDQQVQPRVTTGGFGYTCTECQVVGLFQKDEKEAACNEAHSGEQALLVEQLKKCPVLC